MTPLREALEAALAADPDDVAAHMAYGDLLAEQGDPRGEFVQVQLALERGEPLRQREAELLEAHRDEWLGPLAPHLSADAVTFRRGWIDAVRVGTLTHELARALADAAELRLLRGLTVVSALNPTEDLKPLFGAKHFGNVRSFSLGDVEGEAGFRTFPFLCSITDLIQPMPRLEQLDVNQVDGDVALPNLDPPPGLRVLRLERIRLWDVGVRELTRGRLFNGLKVLQIWNARFGDAGARALARCPAVKDLDLLDVSFNWLTPKGIAALRKACRHVVAEYQMTEADDVDDEFGEFDLSLE